MENQANPSNPEPTSKEPTATDMVGENQSEISHAAEVSPAAPPGANSPPTISKDEASQNLAPSGADAPPEPTPPAKPDGAATPAGDAKDEPLPVHKEDIIASVSLGLAFVVTMLLSIIFARPFQSAGLQAFENPDAVGNSIWYVVLLIFFTILILWIARKGKDWLIRLIILSAVAGTMVYVVPPFLLLANVPSTVAWLVGAAVGIGSAIALYVHPEWYVIDIVGVLVAAGAAAIFGISLGIVPVIVLLVVLAVYDAIAVYKTKHMLALADSVMELRLPVLLVIPKHRGYRFRDEVARFKEADATDGENKDEREALFMGLGDLVFPAVLVVSAMIFAGEGWGMTPSIGTIIGTIIGYVILMRSVLTGRPQAGLPLLNGGAILGFLVGVLVATGGLVL